jgi:hypothetical protein
MLGEALVSVFGSPRGPTTIHASVHEWRDPATGKKAGRRGGAGLVREMPKSARLIGCLMAPLGLVIGMRARRIPKLAAVPPETESSVEAWIRVGERVRVERSWTTQQGPEHLAIVYEPRGRALEQAPWHALGEDLIRGTTTTRGWPWPAPNSNTVDRLFNPSMIRELFGHLDLRETGEAVVAGRPAACADATPTTRHGLWPHWLPFGADLYRFAIDAEYGFLLSIQAVLGERPFESIEVTSLAIDEPIADVTFHLKSH